ncbi:hypothetical protein B0T14DRAFT_570462 [Immersiella caudata]|uniref:Uncharacterized protein n=1 Tax=Immersiella caudata TaxID=314043 RepID=A0AA39WFP7_9PEZI|nr:hypothetical protein B0T14DRAFT_570462 [Immersiella caudata]
MAPRLVSGGRHRRGVERELFIRTDGYESESDYDSDSDDEDTQPRPAPPPATTQTGITTPTVTPPSAITPPSVQAGAVNPSDPNGALTRVSEDGMHTGGRIGVGIGVVAGVIMLFGITYFIWGRKRRSRQRLELERSPSIDRLVKPEPAADDKPPEPRTQSQILNELMAEVYGGGDSSTTDEKRQSDYPYQKAKMRPSMASWLRRHHPLQLNSLSRWSTSTSKTRPSSTATSLPSNRNTTASLALGPETGIPAVPPLPTLPPKARDSDRFKSVWSDTSAGTVETDSDTKSRGYASILLGYQEPEWDKTEKRANPVPGK